LAINVLPGKWSVEAFNLLHPLVVHYRQLEVLLPQLPLSSPDFAYGVENSRQLGKI
jgi:hypothetical protein